MHDMPPFSLPHRDLTFCAGLVDVYEVRPNPSNHDDLTRKRNIVKVTFPCVIGFHERGSARTSAGRPIKESPTCETSAIASAVRDARTIFS